MKVVLNKVIIKLVKTIMNCNTMAVEDEGKGSKRLVEDMPRGKK